MDETKAIMNPDFTPSQQKILNAVNIISEITLFLNLALATYILLRMIIPLKIKGVFILQFYLISIILTILRITEVWCILQDPSRDMWEYTWTEADFYRISAISATCFFYALGLLVISTMFQIAVSI